MATKYVNADKVTPVPADQWASPRKGGTKSVTPRGTAQASPLPKKTLLGKKPVAVKNTTPANESGTQSGKPDLINRDPKKNNAHLKLFFSDIIGERTTTNSIDCVWRCAYSCFTCCKNYWYRLGTLFCACPISVIYGISFCVPAFTHVWCCTPLRRILEITFVKCFNRCITMCLKCLIGQCSEACGSLFRHFNPNAAPSDKTPLLPVTSKPKGRQVKFNDDVKTKRIPRQTNALHAPTGRRQLVQNKR